MIFVFDCEKFTKRSQSSKLNMFVFSYKFYMILNWQDYFSL